MTVEAIIAVLAMTPEAIMAASAVEDASGVRYSRFLRDSPLHPICASVFYQLLKVADSKGAAISHLNSTGIRKPSSYQQDCVDIHRTYEGTPEYELLLARSVDLLDMKMSQINLSTLNTENDTDNENSVGR